MPAAAVPRTTGGLADARDGTQNIHPDGGQVRLDCQINGRWTLAAKAGKDVLVGCDELLERSNR